MACSNCKKIKHDLKVARRATGHRQDSNEVSSSPEARYFETERDKALSLLAKFLTSTQDFLQVQNELTESLETGEVQPHLLKRATSKAAFLSRFLDDTLESAGIYSVPLVGQSYSAGLMVEAANLDDFVAGDHLVIDEVIRPLLLFKPTTSDEKSKLLQMGRVTVKKDEA